MARAFADIAFTPSVRMIQKQFGSADGYAKFLGPDAQSGNRIGPREAEFIAHVDGFFQASISETGWPYVQFRGGGSGFVKVLDDQTIAYADYRGNRQYISAGNLSQSARISLIAVDYPTQRRLKLWGEAELVDPDTNPELLARIYDGKETVERIVKIRISALDWNCPRHIPRRFTLDELEPQLAVMRERLAELETENTALKNNR